MNTIKSRSLGIETNHILMFNARCGKTNFAFEASICRNVLASIEFNFYDLVMVRFILSYATRLHTHTHSASVWTTNLLIGFRAHKASTEWSKRLLCIDLTFLRNLVQKSKEGVKGDLKLECVDWKFPQFIVHLYDSHTECFTVR